MQGRTISKNNFEIRQMHQDFLNLVGLFELILQKVDDFWFNIIQVSFLKPGFHQGFINNQMNKKIQHVPDHLALPKLDTPRPLRRQQRHTSLPRPAVRLLNQEGTIFSNRVREDHKISEPNCPSDHLPPLPQFRNSIATSDIKTYKDTQNKKFSDLKYRSAQIPKVEKPLRVVPSSLVTQLLRARKSIDSAIKRRSFSNSSKATQLKDGETMAQSTETSEKDNYWKGVLISEISVVETETIDGEDIPWLLN